MSDVTPDNSRPGGDGLAHILAPEHPFGFQATETMFEFGKDNTNLLFDRRNLVYRQSVQESRPTYIVGRKGAGKTAFLVSSQFLGSATTVELDTGSIYREMLTVLRTYTQAYGQPFVDETAKIWLALFDNIAMFHAHQTATQADEPQQLQALSDYFGSLPADTGFSGVAGWFLRSLRGRIDDHSGLPAAIDGVTSGGVRFFDARSATRSLLGSRVRPLIIVMDNLEDLAMRLYELTDVLAGLFRCTGRVVSGHVNDRPYGIQMCLPSEIFDRIHEIAMAPEKDLQGSYLKIYWTARELLRLAGGRFNLFLRLHHPEQLDRLERKAALLDEPDPPISLLRAALPERMTSGLDIEEDPLAYLLRHTQLLPRHLIGILNSVFSRKDKGSTPWAVTPSAVLAGTRHAEQLLVAGVLKAYSLSYPKAAEVLRRLSGRLNISFPANELHQIYNREGIRALAQLDFDEFISMLFDLGVVGIRFEQTGRYNKAHFQYTFDNNLVSREETDHLCLHPLFTRYLLERSIPRLRDERSHATYPYGCDPKGDDYRHMFGYFDN
jgi:hypothetical protein